MAPKARTFLKQWRRRWAMKYRRLPLGPTITETESQKKALVKIIKPFYGSTTTSLQAEPEHEKQKNTQQRDQFFSKSLAQS